MTQHQKDAALAVALMDLTSLNTSDTTKSIQALVDSINPTLGTPAAVCVYSDFVDDAKIALAARELNHVKVATVTNFPTGDAPLSDVINETLIAIERGADEIDLVIPYKKLIAGDAQTVVNYVSESKKACGSRARIGLRGRERGEEACVVSIQPRSRDARARGASQVGHQGHAGQHTD